MQPTDREPTDRPPWWLKFWPWASPTTVPERLDLRTRFEGALVVDNVADKYEALYQYLEKRYASAVVLTFAQIEDLLGFPLSTAARADRAWWSNVEHQTGAPARAWTRASRTATVNFGAQTVLFERYP